MGRKIVLGISDRESYLFSGADAIVWLEEAIESEKGKRTSAQMEVPQYYEFGDKYLCSHRREINDSIFKLYEALLEILVPELNSIHRQSATKKQWEALIGYWIYRYVSSFFIKYLKLKSVMEKYSGEDFTIVVEAEKERLVAVEIVDFLLLVRSSDSFCIQQYCELADWFRYPLNKEKIVCNTKAEDKKLSLSNAVLAGKKVYKRPCDVLLYQSYLPENLISSMEELSKGRIRNYPGIPLNYIYSCIEDCPINAAMRDKLCLDVESEDRFFSFLAGNAGKYLPKSYVEGFMKLCEISNKYFDVKPHNVVTAPAGLTHDDLFKTFLFQNREHIVLRDIQHGGNYGVIDSVDRIERRLADKLYTFGWEDTGEKNNNCVPMPAVIGLKYLNAKNEKREFSRRILYTGISVEKYRSNMVDYYSVSQLNKMETDFFCSLDREILRDVVVRLIGSFRGDLNRTDFFRKNFPDVTVRNHLPFFKELLNARLLIAPSMDTTYLEAIWTNTPVMIVCPPETYRPTEKSVPVLNRMKEAGVLMDSPKRAAELVNRIAGHEMEWWMERDRQKIVAEFKREFAWLPRASYLRWGAQLMRVTAGKSSEGRHHLAKDRRQALYQHYHACI